MILTLTIMLNQDQIPKLNTERAGQKVVSTQLADRRDSKMSADRTVLVVLVTIACLTALASAAVLEKKYGVSGELQPSGGPKAPKNLCKMCQRSIDRIKSSGDVSMWKMRLEMLCQFSADELKIKDCKKMVAQYMSDLDNLNSLQFCQELKMCPTDDKEATS